MTQHQVTFLHISDTHIADDPAYTREGAPTVSRAGALALVEAINAVDYPVDFVLHTGDVAYDPHPEAYAACAEILGAIRWPVIYAAGNHDDTRALQTTLMGRADDAVQAQLHSETAINGVQVVVVDSNGPAELPAGSITESQLAWLRGICAADDPRPLVIATHHNPTPTGVPWLDDYMGIQNGDAFHQAILPARDRLKGVFFGHVHQNVDLYRDGVLYASTLSSWLQFDSAPTISRTRDDVNAEPGYSVVTVGAWGTTIRRCRFPIPH